MSPGKARNWRKPEGKVQSLRKAGQEVRPNLVFAKGEYQIQF
jgi:hypothetical protein